MLSSRDTYFGLQRLRGGVSPAMVAAAEEVLTQPGSEILRRVSARLGIVHGPAATDPEWLRRRPLVERTSLVAQMTHLASTPAALLAERRKTSGSTGEPFRLLKDRQMSAWMDATMWAVYGWHGIRPGDRQARFWGAPLTAGALTRQRAIDWMYSRLRLSAFRVNRRDSLAFFAALRGFSPRYAYGYPTLIHEFVRHCGGGALDGRALGLRVVICTGELLLDSVRRRIADFFGCPVVNEYGCTESGIIAIECEAGSMHMVPVAAFGEIVRSDGIHAAPGETGEVVVTDLYGRHAPLVRYRLHDLAVPAGPAACPCGRDLPTIAVQRGRIDSFIETPARGRVYDAILAYTVPSAVLRFRVFQEAVDHLRAEIVPGPGFDPGTTPSEAKCRWEAALGPGMEVSVTTVSDIPLTAAGKLRYFVPSPKGLS